jgi:hypothetical protein
MIPHDPFQTDDAAAPHEIVRRRFAAEAFPLKSRASAEIGGEASVPGVSLPGVMSSMERSRPPMITPSSPAKHSAKQGAHSNRSKEPTRIKELHMFKAIGLAALTVAVLSSTAYAGCLGAGLGDGCIGIPTP